MVGNNGKTYEQNYKGINNVDPNNFYFHFTIEKAHLEFDAVTGDENNTGAFWSAHSPAHKVEANQTFVTRFTNYTAGGDNWNNFLVVLATADGTTEYSVLRADNFGWGTGYDASIRTTEEGRDWAEWIGAMDGQSWLVTMARPMSRTTRVSITLILITSTSTSLLRRRIWYLSNLLNATHYEIYI